MFNNFIISRVIRVSIASQSFFSNIVRILISTIIVFRSYLFLYTSCSNILNFDSSDSRDFDVLDEIFLIFVSNFFHVNENESFEKSQNLNNIERNFFDYIQITKILNKILKLYCICNKTILIFLI